MCMRCVGSTRRARTGLLISWARVAGVEAADGEENGTTMIIHMVLLRIRADVSPAQVEGLFGFLAGLPAKIPGLVSFSGGPYASPEGLQRDFTHGFSMSFESAAARDVYLAHPEHEKVKQKVLAILDGGLSGVIAFDYAT